MHGASDSIMQSGTLPSLKTSQTQHVYAELNNAYEPFPQNKSQIWSESRVVRGLWSIGHSCSAG